MTETADLKQVTALVSVLKSYNKEIDELEQKLKSLTEQRDRISNIEIPEIFMAAGLQSLKLDTGEQVTISTFYSASLSDENPNKPKALAWLREHNFDAIIKNQVSVSFGKGQNEAAATLVNRLQQLGYESRQTQMVHPQTLKAFVRERIENGEDFPRELFKVYEGKQTKIK